MTGGARPVGWYVHHQGVGHLARAAAVAPLLPELVVFSSLPRPRDWERGWIELPRDDAGEPREVEAGGALHWAPLGDPGLRGRMGRIAGWIAAEDPAALVVDVSVEVALLARLHGVPTVVVGQRGRRDDAPHALAYRAASAVVVPWTRASHVPGQGLPDGRLRFVGSIPRFRPDPDWPAAEAGGDVLVLLGFGGSSLTAEAVVAAAGETPERTWHLAGPLRASGPANLVDHGRDAPVVDLLRRSSVVVGAAGGSTIAEVAAARRHFLCVPERRPFDEQFQGASALRRLDLAEVEDRWPGWGRWKDALAAAESRPVARWEKLEEGDGPARMAAVVRSVATDDG
jgi:UDP-N-acetylglucosamine--N-acetylmuramyl-(pentapeptide) pyrophosphoryl-undecaprenol N-acetylglucosamine transferase